MRFRKTLLAILVSSAPLSFAPSAARAQQIECDVQVNYESVPTTNKDLLRDFGDVVKSYMSNYTWGSDDQEEKVKCAMTIFIKGVIGENRYSAQAFVGSQRPVFKSERSTAVVRLFDESWEFTYVKDRAINHNPYTFNDLTSFLDFYAYIILGYDYDTYEELSGTPWFQKASDVASLGRSTGQRGWQPSNSGYSRAKLIDELMNPKYIPVRVASCKYHFKGIDSLSTNPDRGMKHMLRAITTIAETRNQVDPRNVTIKAFFDTKYMELADVFQAYPDPSVYVALGNIDPAHRNTYEEYATRRR